MKIIFSKIKYKAGEAVTLSYEIQKENQPTDYIEFKSADEPHPHFVSAFTQLKDFIPELIECPEEWIPDLTVIGVSINSEYNGAVITALKSLKMNNSPLVLNTPFVSRAAAENGDMGVMSPRLEMAINGLKSEAVLYIEGKRAQGDLFQEKAV